MRWLISSILITSGGMLLYLFVDGAFLAPSKGATNEDSWAAMLGAFWHFDLHSACILFASLSSLLYGFQILLLNPQASAIRWGEVTPWGRAMHSAYAINVLVCGALMAVLFLSFRDQASHSTIGHLYVLCLLMALVGSFLAFAMIWQKKSKILYASTVSVHLFEMAVLAAIFTSGLGV